MSQDGGPLSRDELRALFGRARYRSLFRAVRARLEAAGATAARSVTVEDLDEDERRAIADLHGWPTLPAGRVQVWLSDLDEALQRSRAGVGLRAILEALGGPLVDRPAARAAAAAARDALWHEAADHPAVADRPQLAKWLEGLRSRGRLIRAARTGGGDERDLLRLALAVVSRLPERGVPLAVLAAEATGDAHGLDPGRPLAALVQGAAVRLAGWDGLPDGAGARRRLWAEVGVLCDDLSAHVLTLGLRPSGDGLLARQLRQSADAGEPRRLTLRELSRAPIEVPPAAVFVCENPAVVAAAADALGARSAALVCVEGFPSTAAMTLLDQVRRTGGCIQFHADFDWDGLRIGAYLHRHTGARPWRFGAADYRHAVQATAGALALRGAATPSPWDPGLEAALAAEGRAVFEEQVLDELLGDVGGGVAGT